MAVAPTTESALGGVLLRVQDWPVVFSTGGWVDLAREVRAELKDARAREKKLIADLALLEEAFVPWSDVQENLPPYERVAQYNVFLASRAQINSKKLRLVAVRRLIQGLEEELAEIKADASGHP